MQSVNYRHLHYFWVVAREGGIARAAERLDVAVQTVSAQVRELEHSLAHALLRSAGRRVELTEAGRAALHYAEQIFQLGEQLPGAVRDAATTPQVRFNVGISDGLPKAVVRQLLEPVLATPHLRLLCQEGEFDDLLAELALHKLDVVLSDRAAPANPNLKVYSHSLGQIPMAWYAAAGLREARPEGFPASLAQAAFVLPTQHSVVRVQLDDWLRRHGIAPRIVGEFEDNASLLTFGIAGMGVFPAPASMAAELEGVHGVRLVGLCEDVMERLYAISAERRVHHPLVVRLIKPASP